MPEVFGWEHLTYTAVFLALAIAAIVLILKYVKTEKTLSMIMRIIGGVLFICILWNRISICVSHKNALLLIPDTFCGISSLVLSLALLLGKRDNIVFHFICYLGFIGGLIVVVYPDFIGQASSIFYPDTISGLLHHSIMFYTILIMTITKYFVPTIKKWYALPLGLCCVVTLGIFEITVLDSNDAMQIFNPLLPDTIFTWWFCGILLLVFSYLVMVVFEYFNVWKKQSGSDNIKTETEEKTL